MKLSKHSALLVFILLLVNFFAGLSLIDAQENRFTVVIDAGHGGHDPGAIGSFAREKDINLSVALKLGSLIETKMKDVKVVFTRKTDIFIPLQERADIVNENHADLFICIHTNSSPSSDAYGAETFTLGLAKTKSNLDVAMRENSVILLENNYKTRYKGFDPASIDSYIMFEFMQDKYIDRSIEFSSSVQNQLAHYCQRADRGVRQAGFWVLHRSACPSVLIELGFISNPAEERYLTSDQGQNELSTAIFNAFVNYKRLNDKKSGIHSSLVSKIDLPSRQNDTDKLKQDVPPNQNKLVENSIKPDSNTKPLPVVSPVKPHASGSNQVKTNMPIFKVQLFASEKALKLNSSAFKGLPNVDVFVENGLNKYTIGAETEYNAIIKLRKSVLSKFPQAFIIAFLGDQKIPASKAKNLVK